MVIYNIDTGGFLLKCSKCGHENAEDANFCENCAASLKKDPNELKGRIDGKNLLIIIIASLICLTLIISVLQSSYSDSNNNKDNYTYVTGVYNSSGIYFQLPDGWKARDGDENSSYIAMALDEYSNLRLHILKDDNYNRSDIVDLEGDIEAETIYLRRWGGYANVFTESGYQVVEGYNKPEDEYVRSYYIQEGTNTYILGFSSDYPLESHLSDIREIVNSFKEL